MRTPSLLVLALLRRPSQVASAGLDLTWNACIPRALRRQQRPCSIVVRLPRPPSCSPISSHRRRSAVRGDGHRGRPPHRRRHPAAVLARRVRWLQRDRGLSLSVSKPTTQCPSATNATPWGPLGTEATSGISAINLGQGGVDRADPDRDRAPLDVAVFSVVGTELLRVRAGSRDRQRGELRRVHDAGCDRMEHGGAVRLGPEGRAVPVGDAARVGGREWRDSGTDRVHRATGERSEPGAGRRGSVRQKPRAGNERDAEPRGSVGHREDGHDDVEASVTSCTRRSTSRASPMGSGT